MIEITNVVAPGRKQMLGVIRGMRNPMNSWNKADSFDEDYAMIGPNDEKLMKQLITAGPEHCKFLRMMPVIFDVKAPLYWWKEMDTYKIGTVRNSCSTMHKITSKEFELDDFSTEYLTIPSLQVMADIIDHLNCYRHRYLDTVSKTDKDEAWWQLIQILPSSYNQKATIFTNYEVLRTIYNQRKGHKLAEWAGFRKFVEDLPYSYLFTDN